MYDLAIFVSGDRNIQNHHMIDVNKRCKKKVRCEKEEKMRKNVESNY